MHSKIRAAAHRFLAPAVLAAAVASATCAAATPDAPADRAGFAQPAWLDQRLPAHTVAYARVPSFWGMVSAPDGRLLDPALASPENVRMVRSLRDSVGRNALLAQTGAAPLFNFWMSDLGGPMEFAVIDGSDQLTLASNVLMTARLDASNAAALNARVTAFDGGTQFLKAPFDADGNAELVHNGVLKFDFASHRLYAFLGLGATRSGLDAAIAQLGSTRSHPMQATEREIDESGQGLFVWVNMKGVSSTFGGQGAKDPSMWRDLIDHSQSMAFGWGTVAGRGSMRIVYVAPGARMLDYFAQGAVGGDLKTAGKPRWVATMTLPGAEQLQAIENNLDQDFGPGTQQKYREGIATLQARTGATPMDFARTIGPDVILFADANGTYMAAHVRDRAGFYALLDRLAQRFGWRTSITRVGNLQIHQVSIPSLTTPPATSGVDPRVAAWTRLFARANTHQYWIEEGDYLVAAQVPQLLMDRAASRLDTRLGDVFHAIDAGHGDETALGFSGASTDAQRDMYYAYLGTMQALGDILGQPVDLMGMPAAGGMQLPIDGRFDISVEMSKSQLRMGLGYEQSPLELITNGSGSLGAVAIAAVVAAIAIPAYQDYTIRSQVSEGAALAEGSKTAVAAYYLVHKKFPLNNKMAGLAAPASIHGKYVSSVTVVNGRVEVAYGGPSANTAIPASALLVFAPSPGPRILRWSCDSAAGTTVNVKYRPIACRP